MKTEKQIRCSTCGEPVSTPIPHNTIIRAYIECSKCIASWEDSWKNTPKTDELRSKIPEPLFIEKMIASHADLERRIKELDKENNSLKKRLQKLSGKPYCPLCSNFGNNQ